MLIVHRTSGFWILVLMFLRYVFVVFVLDAIFCGTNFFIFQDSVWLVKKSWCVPCCSIYRFYWLSDRCRSGFAVWWFMSEKSCRHKLVVFTSFWSWLLNVSSVLTSLKYTATIFWVVNALWVCWQFLAVLRFWFWSVSEICHFLCLSLMRTFVVQIFSFFRTVCG